MAAKRESNATFDSGIVGLDNVDYINCTFKNCMMVYAGGAPGSIDGCTFENVQWTFNGPAGATIAFLTALYRDPAFRPLIDSTFEQIRKGGPLQPMTLN